MSELREWIRLLIDLQNAVSQTIIATTGAAAVAIAFVKLIRDDNRRK